ncbi:longitudinals lacking protein-like isoform X1 [Plodia interpunctella]|uniref:longitudinals lacking protein-like isoform X1 n=1 Tax=Plodia interpunctella TaxID=58824 RepID=UPI002367F2C9|nr:longitudinals lacking protein-like isoform X1 [Plodia interpunctella]XP_053606422.1 longitudinals lacking protein-like isoform X1 [Plodia interpunctella]XP_053606423.1 longitudinals lacking protein-like isoform X1 [Plodia interpunctella]XP_053606424.1 longitudinals lacking protein-like isoform X1 [Plodia interpunctella]
MDDDQQFCLRWNNHQSTLVSVFDTLLEKGIHVDCTLAAEGQTLKAHKVVLSACSPYFESVLSQQYDKHPIIILKDVKYAELRAMMDYMYRGEVNISQDQLAALLKAAESLQIKGLSDNKPSRPPSRPAAAVAAPAHPPRAPSPPPQVRDGSIDSREGSVSPTRRRKKARRGSAEVAPAAAAPEPQGNGEEHACKEEAARDGVEDLTLDEEADDPPPTHNDVVRNFQWHMERSQDEIMNSSDSVRDSQELHKEASLPALLSLLSVQQQLVPSCIQLTNIQKPTGAKDINFPQFPKLAIDSIPDNIKAHLLQQAFMQNNNSVGQSTDYKPTKEEDSDAEYDDTDDIVLQEEAEGYYDNGAYISGAGNMTGDMFDNKSDTKGHYGKRDGNSSDDASRQFECRHCGKKYRWKSTLRRHENVECGGKAPSHQCPYCSYKAKQRGNLGVHIRKHHNNEWYIYASNKVRRNKKTSI